MSGLTELGLSRHAAYRELTALEEEGLVAVTRRTGRKPLVTVIKRSGTVNGPRARSETSE